MLGAVGAAVPLGGIQPHIAAQVDDGHAPLGGGGGEEGRRPVRQRKKDDLDRGDPLEIDRSQQPIATLELGMQLAETPALRGVTADVGQLDIGVPVEETDQFAPGISGGAEDGGS